MSNKYTFKPYSDLFPQLFAKEKARLEQALGSLQIEIEHIGSTAVVGLGGKGIIDIGIAVDSVALDLALKRLVEAGYEYRPQHSKPDRIYLVIFREDPEQEKRRYHLHLTNRESQVWKELLAFRDYLRKNPDAQKEYAKIKQQAAKKAQGNGDIYFKMKVPYIQKKCSINGGSK